MPAGLEEKQNPIPLISFSVVPLSAA